MFSVKCSFAVASVWKFYVCVEGLCGKRDLLGRQKSPVVRCRNATWDRWGNSRVFWARVCACGVCVCVCVCGSSVINSITAGICKCRGWIGFLTKH